MGDEKRPEARVPLAPREQGESRSRKVGPLPVGHMTGAQCEVLKAGF